jgi:uncharacterized membrane protein
MTTAAPQATTYATEPTYRAPTRPSSYRADTDDNESWARALGWFSIGLGLAQIAAPRAMARLIGIPDDRSSRNTMLALGLREMTSGVGILSQPQSSTWLWSRVGGDLMDLALLGRALGSDRTDRGRLAAATAAVAGVTLLDVVASRRVSGDGAITGAPRETQPVTKSLTINRPPDEVYTFWRNFENLPRFMEHLESVRVLDGRRSHWKAKAPVGQSVEWDAEITDDEPGSRIAWRSVEGAQVPNRGEVRFVPAPGGRGTELHVEICYDPPAGKLGVAVAKLFGEEPAVQVDGDLRRFKQVMETGEVVRSDASIHHGPHPARPSAPAM